MTIAPYTTYNRDEILPLYESVGWVNYTKHPAMLEAAYRGSLLTLAAYDGEALVGIIRTVGDGVSVVFIQDIVVHPRFQRRGIGTKLIEAVLARFHTVYQIELLTDDTPKTTAFYESLGFTRSDKYGCCAFVRMN